MRDLGGSRFYRNQWEPVPAMVSVVVPGEVPLGTPEPRNQGGAEKWEPPGNHP